GARVGPEGSNHLGSLQATLRDVTVREARMSDTLNKLNAVHPNLGTRLRNVLSPLFQQSQFYRSAMAETEQMAAGLARTNGQMLSGVTFGEGGIGPETQRTAKALISTQMSQRGQELAARGVTEPTRLIPSAQAAGTRLMGTIRQLPISIGEAKDKVIGIIGA